MAVNAYELFPSSSYATTQPAETGFDWSKLFSAGSGALGTMFGGPAGGAVGAIGGAAIGGLLGSNALSNSGDQAREASRRSIELGKNQALVNSQTMSPFIGAGMMALQELFGYSPGGTTAAGAGGGSGISATVPTLKSEGDSWKSPTYVGGTTYSKTGTGLDPTGGAGQFMDQLKNYGTNFQFDTSNPAYQQQLSEQTRALNDQLAARGMYNSRAGMNVIENSTRNLMAGEYDKQYARGYSNLMDMFNLSNTLGQQKYNSLLDAVKIGTGAGATAGGLGNQAVGNIQSAYGQMAGTAMATGQNQANLYTGLGAMPLNYMILQNLLGKK